jgi:hypothetical protein
MAARSLLLALGLMACAHNPAPSGTLPTPEELPLSPYGGYILVRHKGGAETGGELLAVADDRVHVRSDQGVRVIPRREIESMRLAVYQTAQGTLGIWGTLGTLSTLSHGFVLVLSVPVWLITATASAAVESRAALVDYPGQPLSAFVRFARYPQGMPPSVTPSWTTPPPGLPPPPQVEVPARAP